MADSITPAEIKQLNDVLADIANRLDKVSDTIYIGTKQLSNFVEVQERINQPLKLKRRTTPTHQTTARLSVIYHLSTKMSKREDVGNRYLASGFHGSGIDSTMARMLGQDVKEKVQFCKECGEPCSPGYSPVQDSPDVYCKTHYEKLFASKCEGCNRPIVGEFVNASGKKYHVQCAPEGSRCERCRQPIFGAVKQTSLKAYHPKCFTCTSCDKLITGSFTDLKGSPFCDNCASEVSLSRSGIPGVTYESAADKEKREQAQIQNELYQNVQGGKEVCNWCRKVVGIDAVEFNKKYFHTECFECGSCGDTIGKGTYTENGGLAYCEKCAPKPQSSSSGGCAGCHQPLSGSYVTALQGAKYHPQCLKCSQCNVVLKGGFAAKAGKVVCASCASSKGPTPAPQQQQQQQDRRTGFVVDPRSGMKERVREGAREGESGE